MFRTTNQSKLHCVLRALVGTGLFALASAASCSEKSTIPEKVVELTETYGQLPMSFEENRGQTASSVKFISRGNGYGLFVTGQEAVLTLRKAVKSNRAEVAATRKAHLNAYGIAPPSIGSNINAHPMPLASSEQRTIPADTQTVDVVRMQLQGSNSDALPVGEDKLPGITNYFRGNDPSKWHCNIPTFARVKFSGVYPGVDLVYYGNQRQLEYDFVVAPGADPGLIKVGFAGASKLKIERNGSLSIQAESGMIALRKPVVYQTVDGERRNIAGQFKMLADRSIGFTLGSYDHAKELVIDPILGYSSYFGGSTADFVVAATSDSAGNAYVTGLTVSEDFPLTAGAFQDVNYASPSNGVSTAFISKFNASGTALLYSTFIGGIGTQGTLHAQGDYGKAIAIDSAGNAFITGYTYSSDFPITNGAFQSHNYAASGRLATGFVTKLNPSGTALVYSTYLGGSVLDQLTAIALDSGGDAFIAGVSASPDFPTTAGVIQSMNKSYGKNGFNYVVTKMNPTGTALVYSTYLGGSNDNSSGDGAIYWTNPIVVDKSGNAYVAGFTTAGDFPVSVNAFQKTNSSGYSVTVSKLNSTATALLYSTYLGGSSGGERGSIGEGLAVDSAGNAYVAGYTSETNFPVTTGAFQGVNHGLASSQYSGETNQNGFITKLNSTGTALVYSTYLGGTTGPWGGDQIYSLALDATGNVYVVGSAMSADFPVTANAYQFKNRGATHCCDYTTYTSNAFLTELNPTGNALIYSTYFGGGGTQNPNGPGGYGDTAYGINLGKNGNVYVVGFTTSANFPVTTGAFNTAYKTQQNPGFLANFNLGVTPTTSETTTSLVSSATSALPGTKVTFTSAVTAVSGTAIPAGNLVLSIDEKAVAVLALSNLGKATYATSGLSAGEHYILASYAGSTTFAASGDGLNEYITPLTPVISPLAGTYESQQTITISNPTPSAVLYYSLDGSTPSRFGTRYSGPFTVDAARTVKAVSVATDSADSIIVSSTFTIIGSPSALAAPTTSISTPKATLNAFVNTLGLAGNYHFAYGISRSAINSSTPTIALGASSARVAASAQLTSLMPKTTYYSQIVVTTAGGNVTGPVVSFTTN